MIDASAAFADALCHGTDTIYKVSTVLGYAQSGKLCTWMQKTNQVLASAANA